MMLGQKYEVVDSAKEIPPDRLSVVIRTNYMRICEGYWDAISKKWQSKDFWHPNETASYWMKKISE